MAPQLIELSSSAGRARCRSLRWAQQNLEERRRAAFAHLACRPRCPRVRGIGNEAVDDMMTAGPLKHLALQLLFLRGSESMGNHDSKIVDAGSVD